MALSETEFSNTIKMFLYLREIACRDLWNPWFQLETLLPVLGVIWCNGFGEGKNLSTDFFTVTASNQRLVCKFGN